MHTIGRSLSIIETIDIINMIIGFKAINTISTVRISDCVVEIWSVRSMVMEFVLVVTLVTVMMLAISVEMVRVLLVILVMTMEMRSAVIVLILIVTSWVIG